MCWFEGDSCLTGGGSEQTLTHNKKGKGRTIKSCDGLGSRVDVYAQSTPRRVEAVSKKFTPRGTGLKRELAQVVNRGVAMEKNVAELRAGSMAQAEFA